MSPVSGSIALKGAPRACHRGSAICVIERDQKFKFIDLFAGLGGFHVAMSRLGGEAVFASEWTKSLQDLYEANYGIRPAGDITKVRMSAIPDHDVLTAGFPCQPFSKAGEQLGFEHTEQGQLFFKVEQILREKRPNYFILENVPNILRHKGGVTIARIERDLRELGYDVAIHRFSPHNFGIPQIRERVYIVGSLGTLDGLKWPDPPRAATRIQTVLDDNPIGAKPVGSQILKVLEAWDEFLRASPQEVEMPSFPLWAMEFGATYPYEDATPFALSQELGSRGLAPYLGSFGDSLFAKTVEEQMASLPSHARRPELTFPKWKQDFIRRNREFYEANKTWIDPVLPQIKQFPSSFQKLEWNSKGSEKTIWKSVIQMRASGVRVKRPTTAPSLIAMTDSQVPIIAWEKRYMTPRECAALQSLEGIKLPESNTAAYRALGNAVNAKVVEAIAGSLLGLAQNSASDASVAA